MPRDFQAEYDAYRKWAVTKEQELDEKYQPDRKTTTARLSAIQQIGGPINIPEGSGYTQEQHRVISGAVYDPSYGKLEDELDMDRNAGIRRLYQKLGHTPADFDWWSADDPEWQDLPSAEQVDSLHDVRPVAARRTQPYSSAIRWRSEDELRVQRGVSEGKLVSERFEVAPAKGYEWATLPKAGEQLPEVKEVSHERIERGVARPEMFDYEKATDIPYLFKSKLDPRHLFRPDVVLSTAVDYFTLSRNPDALRALNEARKLQKKPVQISPFAFEYKFDDLGRGWYESKDPEYEEAINDPVTGQQLMESPGRMARSIQYMWDINREVDRLNELGFKTAARRESYERFVPVLAEAGWDLLEATIWTLDAIPIPSKIDPWPAIRGVMPTDRERQSFKNLRLSTWDNLTAEGKEKAANDPEYFIRKMYQQREYAIKNQTETGYIVEYLEDLVNSMPIEFPVSDPHDWGKELGPGEPYEEDPEKVTDQQKKRIELTWAPGDGLDLATFKRDRVDDLTSRWFEDHIEREDGKAFFVWNGERVELEYVTFDHLQAQMSEESQWAMHADVSKRLAAETAFLILHGTKKAQELAEKQTQREVQGLKVVGLGFTFFDTDYLRTTNSISKGLNPFTSGKGSPIGGGDQAPWIKDIPVIGDILEGPARIARAGTARTPAMYWKYYPSAGVWRSGRDGPTQWEARHRTGIDWLMGWVGTTWEAGMLEPMRNFLRENESDAGDLVYRYMRSLTNSPYEYTLTNKEGEEDSFRLMAMGTSDHDWFNDLVDGMWTATSDEELLAAKLGDSLSTGQELSPTAKRAARVVTSRYIPSGLSDKTLSRVSRARVGYKQFNKDTGKIELITKKEILDDFVTVLEETYNATIGPEMSPTDRTRQVESIRQHKFLAHEMGAVWAELADSLEVDQETKNAMVIGGSITTGFGQEFANPIDPLLWGMRFTGKGLKYAKKTQKWKRETRPAYLEQMADDLMKELDDELAKIQDQTYTAPRGREEDEALIFDMIYTRARERGMKTDHAAQLIVDGRIAHQQGHRHSISWSMDKARANVLRQEREARQLMSEWGYQEPRWTLSGIEYATPTDRLFRVEEKLRGTVKYQDRHSRKFSMENPEPGLLDAIKDPREARSFANGVVADEVTVLAREVLEDTKDLDVYRIFRTEKYIKENFSEKVWEIAQREQNIALGLEAGDTSKLYPVYLGRLETKVPGQPVIPPTNSSWADKLGQSSTPTEARWAPTDPIRNVENPDAITQWKLVDVEEQITLGITQSSPAKAYPSEFVFGGRFQGTNTLPSPNKNAHGRTFNPKTAEGDLPQWYNPLTAQYESPTAQGLKQAGQLEDYEKWVDLKVQIERSAEESLELALEKATLEADEWFDLRGSFVKRHKAVSDKLETVRADLDDVNARLAEVVSELEPSYIAASGYQAKIGSLNANIVRVRDNLKIAMKALKRGKYKRGSKRGDELRARITSYQSELTSFGSEKAALEVSLADLVTSKKFRNLHNTQVELNAKQIQLGAEQSIAMDEMLKVDELFAGLPKATSVKTTAGVADLEMEIGRGLRASQSRIKQALKAQGKRRKAYERIAGKSSTGKREAAFRTARMRADDARRRLESSIGAYREVANDIKKGLEAVDDMPKDTARFINILEESGAISKTRSPDPISWFRSTVLKSIVAYNDDGSRAVDVDKLMDYLRTNWGDHTVDYITESIIGGPKTIVQATIDGRPLGTAEQKKMAELLKKAREKLRAAKEEKVAYVKSDEYRKANEVQRRGQLELYREKTNSILQEVRQNEVMDTTVIGTRGGRAGDVLHRIKEAQGKGIKTVDLSLEEIENFQHINTGLRHAYRESHEARRGLSYLEAMDQADQDVFGSLAIRATYYLKPTKDKSRLNFYIFPSILQKALYKTETWSLLNKTAKRYMQMLNPVSMEIGEVSKDVENVFRAYGNLLDHTHTELYDFLRMQDKANKSMSSAFREEAFVDAVIEMMMKTEVDEPLSIAYTSPMKSSKVWIHSGGPVHWQARQAVNNNPALANDLSIIAEQQRVLDFVAKEAGRLNPVGSVEALKKSITAAFTTGQFKNMPNKSSVLDYLIDQIDLWKTPPSGQRRSVDTLIGQYSKGREGIRDVSKIKGEGEKAIRQLDDILIEAEPITLNRLLGVRWNMGGYENWFARAQNFRESHVVMAWSRAFIPHGQAASPSRAAYYYYKTLGLFQDPRSVDFKWLLDQVRKMHMRDFGPETNITRAVSTAALASSEGMILYRTNRNLERAIGGFLTPAQVRAGNEWLQNSENTIKGWEGALDANIRMGRPIKQHVIRTGEKKKLTDYVLSGMDESGRSFWGSRRTVEAANEATERIVKENAMQYARARTPEQALQMGAQWSALRLWRTSIVTGLVVPQPRYFYNNFWGDFSQIWLTEGLYTSGKINFQLLSDIPWWSNKLDNYQRRVTEFVHKKSPNSPVLGSTFNALLNPWANRVWRGEKGYLRLPDGRLKSFNSIRMDLINGGILDTQANHDLLSSLARVTPHSWKEVPGIGAPLRRAEGYLDEYYRGQASGITGDIKALGAMGTAGVGKGLQATTDMATDWRQNISWWATYVQQRQRGNFYMEMLRRGYSEKEAIARTFSALYDWKHGITQWEVKWLARYVPFYRFWRLALGQISREVMQPIIRPSAKMVDVHMLGMKASIPGEYVGQSALGRVRQQHVAREMIPYWTEPELWEELAQDEDQLLRYAHALRPEWLHSRAVWGWKVLPEDQRKFYWENRGRSLSYSVNALGPFTALDTTEFFMSSNKLLMGLLLKAMPGDSMNSYMAPDWEEAFFKSSMDMLNPVHKDMTQQYLASHGVDAGGFRRGEYSKMRPGEATMSNSTIFGIEGHIDPETKAPMAETSSLALYRLTPIVGTEMTGLMQATWGDNMPMQKFSKAFRDSAQTAEAKDFIDGLHLAFGRLGGFKQQYPTEPQQVIRHKQLGQQKAWSKAMKKFDMPHLIEDRPYPYPYDWREDQPTKRSGEDEDE